MSDFRQRLHATLDDQHTDLRLLATRAQRQGAHLRRRRRLVVATGSIALAGVLTAGVISAAQLLPDHAEDRPATGYAGTVEATVPASGQSVAAALYAAVTDVADGTVERIHGGMMSPVTDDGRGVVVAEHVNASFGFTPAGADHPGEVSLTILHQHTAGELWDMVADLGCHADMLDCRSATLPDGSEVLTYRMRVTHEDGQPDGDVVYAKRVVGDVAVTVFAASGTDEPSAVLTTDQVEQIISLPWGTDLPADLADADLPSFELYPRGAGAL